MDERGRKDTGQEVVVLGLHVNEMEIFGVLLGDGQVLKRWTEEYGDGQDLVTIEKALKLIIKKGVEYIVVNSVDSCEILSVVIGVCQELSMSLEEFHLDVLYRGISYTARQSLSEKEKRGFREAWLLARAKQIEIELMARDAR